MQANNNKTTLIIVMGAVSLLAQGFFFSKPMDACDATSLVALASAAATASTSPLLPVPALVGPFVH